MFVRHFIDYQLRGRLKHVIVHVTNHCNFRCHHCFIDFSPKRDLPLEKYQELGRDLGRLAFLDIGGGEPFMRKDLVEICSAFDAEVLTVPTNGWFVERVVETTRRIRERVAGELTIALSVDGLEATHDRVREAGSWARLWETFERLREVPGVRIKMNTVLCRENAGEILELMRVVRARNPEFHSVILMRGNPIDPTYGLPTREELRALQGPIFALLATYDYGQNPLIAHMLRNYHRYLWNVSLATLDEGRQVIPCLAGSAHAVIMGNGDVSACEMLPPIGNVRTARWHEIWGSAAQRAQRDGIRRGECHCTHNCAMLDSVLLRPASYPRLLGSVTLAR